MKILKQNPNSKFDNVEAGKVFLSTGGYYALKFAKPHPCGNAVNLDNGELLYIDPLAPVHYFPESELIIKK